jgi:hypothetical protein
MRYLQCKHSTSQAKLTWSKVMLQYLVLLHCIQDITVPKTGSPDNASKSCGRAELQLHAFLRAISAVGEVQSCGHTPACVLAENAVTLWAGDWMASRTDSNSVARGTLKPGMRLRLPGNPALRLVLLLTEVTLFFTTTKRAKYLCALLNLKKLRGLSPRANYTGRVTSTCRRS